MGIDKFNGENSNLWKFKIEIILAFMNFWNIVNGSKVVPSSNLDPKMLKKYERYIKKAMFIIDLNLADNQLTYIKICKGPT
jgi:hypothetical protein